MDASILTTTWDKAIDLGKTLITRVCDVIDQCVSDKDLALKLKSEIALKIQDQSYNLQMKILDNEAASNSKFIQYWRPMIMYCFILILFCYGIWNMLFFPFFTMWQTGVIVKLTLEWDLVSLIGGVTGFYVVSRSAEKITKEKNK